MSTRRNMLKTSAAGLIGLGLSSAFQPLFAGGPESRKFRISACDWSIGKRCDFTAMEFASVLGLNGVQISVVNTDDEVYLTKDIRKKYRKLGRENGTRVSGLAIGQMNSTPFKSDPRTIDWVSESIDLAKKFDVKVVLLAFFGKGDLKGDEAGTKEVIRRLKTLMPKAEKAGIILGIESWLSAEEHMRIIDEVASPNLKVYYDVANSNKMGYDIYEEIAWLGKEQICEFHFKENDFLLGQGRVDFDRIRSLIDDIGYEGWVIIEGATPKGMKIKDAYLANVKYVNSLMR